jgi:hypothetical protein
MPAVRWHTLQATPREIDQLFAQLLEHLLGGVADVGGIYSWSTDWADYFRPGLEWWGAHLWTVARKSRPHIVGIAASSTD